MLLLCESFIVLKDLGENIYNKQQHFQTCHFFLQAVSSLKIL